MFMKYLLALSAIAVELSLIAAPASALTMAECSAKYNSAKDADTLDGMTWNQFRKAECGADATDEAPAKADKSAAASDDVAAKRLTAKECSTKYNAAKEADSLDGMTWNQFRTAECGPGATIAAAPAKVDKETTTAADDEAKGLTAKECGAKYQAGKDADSLNGMKWNDFRKAECGPGTTAAFVPAKKTKAADADENAGKSLSMKECSAKYQNAKANVRSRALNGTTSARTSAVPTRTMMTLSRLSMRQPTRTSLRPRSRKPRAALSSLRRFPRSSRTKHPPRHACGPA